MLPVIEHPAALWAFLTLFDFRLYQPQLRHLLQLLDTLWVCPGKKTLSNLYRHLFHAPDPKTAADFFRESPWKRDAISLPRKQVLLLKFLELARPLGLTTLVVSLDDSLGPKHKDTRHLEAVAYHHDHNASGPGAPAMLTALCMSRCISILAPLGSPLILACTCAKKPCAS